MPVLGACALVGVLLGLWLPIESPPGVAGLLALLVSGCGFWFVGPRALLLVLGIYSGWSAGHVWLARLLPAELVRQDIVVVGTVADFGAQMPHGYRFILDLDHPAAGPQRLRLNSYEDHLQPAAGERWQLLVRLREPRGALNPGGVDSAMVALRRGIHAAGYVRASKVNRRFAATGQYQLLQQRADIITAMKTQLGSQPGFPLLAGITLAARQYIDDQQWSALRRTGTGHLMAISGLHIGMVAMAGVFVADKLLWLLAWLGVSKVPRIFRMVGLLPAFGYAALAGFSVPTLRAMAMVALFAWCVTRARLAATGSVLAGALLLVLLTDPVAALAPGFWLSFLAVALLLSLVAAANTDQPTSFAARMRAWVAGLMQTQLVLGVGLAIPVVLLFGELSIVSPLANLLAVPWFGISILPLALLGVGQLMLLGSTTLLSMAATQLHWLMELLSAIAAVPGAFLGVSWLSGIWVAVAALVCVCLLAPRPLPLRLPAAGFAVIAAVVIHSATRDELRVHVLDVGQGLAVLVRQGDEALLFDAGPAWQGGDAGSRFVLPTLDALGVQSLQTIVVSHWDSDHSGGLRSVLAGRDTHIVFASRPGARADIKTVPCRRGISWRWQGVNFDFLHPRAPHGWSDNDASCVLRIMRNGGQVLLTGDIGSAVEQLLTRRYDLANTELIVVAHHGSRTSSATRFAATVQPQFAIVSAAYANRWGFPHPEVRERWNTHSDCVLITGDTGALSFTLEDDGQVSLDKAAAYAKWRPWALQARLPALCGRGPTL